MTIWPFIFVRQEEAVKMKKLGWWDEMLRHEEIHCAQQKEMLLVGVVIALAMAFFGCRWWSLLPMPLFYWWYIVEWLIRLGMDGSAYRNISFEREAYRNQYNKDYLKTRPFWAFLNYIVK